MVAMTPLITIQIMGLIYQMRDRKAEKVQTVNLSVYAELGDNEIIEL